MAPVSSKVSFTVATPTSYLQTLSAEDASAFITSLQKVQTHLTSELEWMNQQVQQKTIQLQGIETLLAEASTLGLLETGEVTVSDGVAANDQTVTAQEGEPEAAENSAPTTPEAPPADNAEATSESGQAVAAPASASTEASQPEQKASKPPARAKSRTTGSKAVTKKKPIATSRSRSKAGTAKSQKDSRVLLRPEFANDSLADAVIRILAQAETPLHINQLVKEMYGDVMGEDLKRVKASLANVLSKGKRTGKWQNVGNGLYQIKTVSP